MRLLSLKINNFLSFHEASINFRNKGLVAVQGYNLDGNGADSNGSGKTTLGLAIEWCNWGETAKQISADDVVNAKYKKNCYVQCHWLDETTDIEYRITRYRKHSQFGNGLTVEKKLPDDDWQDDTKGTPKLTQPYIDNILGMDINVFRAACFATGASGVDIPAMTDANLKKLLESALPVAKVAPIFEKYNKQYLDKLKTVSESKNKLDLINTEINVYNEYIEEKNKRREELLIEIEEKKQKYLSHIDALKDQVAVLKSKSKDESKFEEVRGKIREARNSIDTSALTKHQASKEHLRKEINSLVSQVKSEMSGVNDECFTCGQKIDNTAKQKIIDNLNILLASKKEEYRLLEEKDVSFQDTQKKLIELEEKFVKVGQLEKENRRILENIKELETKIKYSTLDCEKLPEIIKAHDPSMQHDREKLLEAQQRAIAAKDKLSSDEDDLSVLEAITEALGPKGFRYYLLEQITPILNDRTNHYLTMLTDGAIGAYWSTIERTKSGEFKEKFSIKVNMNGRSNYGSLSAGQQRKVKLSCFLALQDAIAAQAEKSCSLFIADEIDHALDKSGIERLMTLLEEKAKSKETILVISHNDLGDYISNVAKVTMREDISEISGVLND